MIPDGFRTVFVEDTLIVIGNEVVGLVPGNLLELAFAAFADALHGIVKAVGMINAAADGSAAQAGAHLVIAINIRAGIVGFDPDDFIVTHV